MIINSVIVGSNGKKYAEGTGSITAGFSDQFYLLGEGVTYCGVAKVTSAIGFVPKLIIVTLKDSNVDVSTIYKSDGWTTEATSKIKTSDDTYYELKGNAKVSASGFTLPIEHYHATTFNWYAYE